MCTARLESPGLGPRNRLLLAWAPSDAKGATGSWGGGPAAGMVAPGTSRSPLEGVRGPTPGSQRAADRQGPSKQLVTITNRTMDAIICKNVVQVPFFFLPFPPLRRFTPTLLQRGRDPVRCSRQRGRFHGAHAGPPGGRSRPGWGNSGGRSVTSCRPFPTDGTCQREVEGRRSQHGGGRERQQGEKVHKNELVFLVDVMRKDPLRVQTIIQR